MIKENKQINSSESYKKTNATLVALSLKIFLCKSCGYNKLHNIISLYKIYDNFN